MLTRLVVIFFVCTLLILWWPRYNLVEKESTWSDKYVLREVGYWSQKTCQQAAAHRSNPARCNPTTTWDGVWGSQVVYPDK